MWVSIMVLAALASGGRPGTQDAPEILREFYESGALRSEQEVIRDEAGRPVPHGDYREFHPDGTPAVTGDYVQGERHRKWEAWHPDGRLRYRGVYSEGFRKGSWVFRDEEGNVDDLRSGDYEIDETTYTGGGLRSKGETRYEQRHGRWVFYWPNGLVKAEGEYVKDSIEGEWVFRHQDGTPDPDWITGVYESGRRVAALPEGSRFELPEIHLERLEFPASDPTRRDAGDFIAALLSLDPERDLANGRAAAVLQGDGGERPEGSFWALCRLPEAYAADAAQRLRLLVLRCHSLYALLEDSPELRWLDLPRTVQEVRFGSLERDHPGPRSLFEAHLPLTDGAVVDGPQPFPYGNRPYAGAPPRKRPSAAEPAVELALRWLALHQDADGRWDCDGFMQHDPDGEQCDGAGSPENDLGVTALALLAFLGNGNATRADVHREAVARGLGWVVAQQDFDSGLLGEKVGRWYMFQHAIATYALCEALAGSDSDALRDAAQKAVNFVCQARNPYGAWRYDHPPVGDNDSAVTGWMVLALHAAQQAGLRIDGEALPNALGFLDEVTDRASGRVGYESMGSTSVRYEKLNERYPVDRTECMTAVGLLCRFVIGQDPEAEQIMRRHADLLLKALPEWDANGWTNNVYYWCFGAHAMFQMGDGGAGYWKKWWTAQRRALLDTQRKDGARLGSWDPVGPWGWSGGRVYATAMGALALEAEWRLEPLRAPR